MASQLPPRLPHLGRPPERCRPQAERPRAGEVHGLRPEVPARAPLHLTMRVAGVPSLRAERCMTVIRAAFFHGKEKQGFRLVHYAVQPDCLHLVVEADDKRRLASGARGLAIRIAMRLNAMLGRAGKVFADRYHAVALTSPRQVRRALAYVLLQGRRHAQKRGRALPSGLDGCSSAPLFDGWKRGQPRAGPWSDTVAAAETWLLTTGWRRHGRIDPDEVPGGRG